MTDPLPRDKYDHEVRRLLDLACELCASDDPEAVNVAERAHWLRRMEPAPRRVINRVNARGGKR